MQRGSFLLTGRLLTNLVGLGAADAYFVERGTFTSPVSEPTEVAEQPPVDTASSSAPSEEPPPTEEVPPAEIPSPPPEQPSSPLPAETPPAEETPSDVTPFTETTPPVAEEPSPTGGVKKQAGPNVLETAVSLGLTFEDTNEKSLIAGVLPEEEKGMIQQRILLVNGDRAGFIAWIESPFVKRDLLNLKEALHSAFSPQVRDLLDEVQRPEGSPPRNFLTFFDPAINEERVVIVRVRERLYEFHVSEAKKDVIFAFIEALAR
ncbi:MAG: hypothetical protein PHI23_00300 [Candidatus Peribacteraceae bacterium]|nr:hypothetical protein [Candidatus Peribacteraceae bacterium]